MSEEEVQHEVQVNPINPIATMIDYITQSEFNKANAQFDELLGQKVSDALEQEKIALAQNMWGDEDEDLGDETTEVDEEDIDIGDDELDAMADEYDDEESEED